MIRDVRVRAFTRIAGLAALASATALPAAAASASTQKLGGRTLKEGMHGPDVTALQKALSIAGYRTRATGRYDGATARNVTGFEQRYQLRVDGLATPRFVRALRAVGRLDVHAVDSVSGGGGLGGTAAPKPRRRHRSKGSSDPTGVLNNPVLAPVKRDGGSQHLGERTLHKGMKGHDVRVLQSYLTLDGYPTDIDGEFGPTTLKSVLKFQRSNSLSDDGVMTYQQTLVLRQAVSKAVTTTASTGTTTLNSDGTATAPAGAPQVVQQVVAAANDIHTMPYIYGGGHGSFQDRGYDCSGAVSYALHGGGLLSTPADSTGLERYGAAGKGQWITTYADASHAFVVIGGLAFDTAHYGSTTPGGSGPRWLQASKVLANLSDGGHYIVRHPSGL